MIIKLIIFIIVVALLGQKINFFVKKFPKFSILIFLLFISCVVYYCVSYSDKSSLITGPIENSDSFIIEYDKQTFYKSENKKDIIELASILKFNESSPKIPYIQRGFCMCGEGLNFTFFKNNKKYFNFSYHHKDHVRIYNDEEGILDQYLQDDSKNKFENWLDSKGINQAFFNYSKKVEEINKNKSEEILSRAQKELNASQSI